MATRAELQHKAADLEFLLKEANKTLTEVPRLRVLGWAELEARVHLLEATLLLVRAELDRTTV